MLAYGLRQIADDPASCPPDLLRALADMFDPPAQHTGATAKIVRPRGGKASGLDAWAIGQEADELAERDGFTSAIVAICAKHGCSETTNSVGQLSPRYGIAAPPNRRDRLGG